MKKFIIITVAFLCIFGSSCEKYELKSLLFENNPPTLDKLQLNYSALIDITFDNLGNLYALVYSRGFEKNFIIKYDGTKSEIIDIPKFDIVSNISIDSKGNIWFLIKVEEENEQYTWSLIEIKENVPVVHETTQSLDKFLSSFFRIKIDDNDNLHIFGYDENKVMKFVGSTWESINLPFYIFSSDIVLDSEGVYLFVDSHSSNDTLYKYDGNTLLKAEMPGGSIQIKEFDNKIYIHQLDWKGGLELYEVLYQYNNNEFIIFYEQLARNNSNNIGDFFIGNSGDLWFTDNLGDSIHYVNNGEKLGSFKSAGYYDYYLSPNNELWRFILQDPSFDPEVFNNNAPNGFTTVNLFK